MRDDIGSIAISLLVLVAIAFARPHEAHCPRSFWLDEGVRASGDYECAAIVPELGARGPRGGWVDVSAAPALRLLGHVYCDAGERATTSDGVTALCAIGGAW